MAYCTTAQVKTWLNIATATTTDDALLSDLIARAQQTIDAYCLRAFEATADSTRRFDAVRDVCGRTLCLDAYLCAITSITNGDGTVLATTDYVTEPRNRTPYHAITLRSDSGQEWAYSNQHENAITVTGRWAYSVSAPNDIVWACIRLVAWLYQQRDTGADVDRVMVSNDGLLLLPQQMPRDVLALLTPYRRL